jgi:hypothetical protein
MVGYNCEAKRNRASGYESELNALLSALDNQTSSLIFSAILKAVP